MLLVRLRKFDEEDLYYRLYKNPDIEKILSKYAEVICLNEKDEEKISDEISNADGILVWHTKISEITLKKLNKKPQLLDMG